MGKGHLHLSNGEGAHLHIMSATGGGGAHLHHPHVSPTFSEGGGAHLHYPQCSRSIVLVTLYLPLPKDGKGSATLAIKPAQLLGERLIICHKFSKRLYFLCSNIYLVFECWQGQVKY